MLDKLEKKLGRFAIPNLTLYLVAGQAVFYMAMRARPEILEQMIFRPELVLKGEVWRLLTFVFMPPVTNFIFLFFVLYLFYLMGTALEGYWGAFRYNLFLAAGYGASIASAFIEPSGTATNAFITGSVFLAFAYLYPDFVIQVFFVLPVKIKWLALLTWAGYFLAFAMGGWQARMLVLASVFNFFLFFGRDVARRIRHGAWHMKNQTQAIVDSVKPFHKCAVCGATDKSHPAMEFRYCPECSGTPCYCMDHIRGHEHR